MAALLLTDQNFLHSWERKVAATNKCEPTPLNSEERKSNVMIFEADEHAELERINRKLDIMKRIADLTCHVLLCWWLTNGDLSQETIIGVHYCKKNDHN